MPLKRMGETSYKETSFGIIPRSKLIPLEIEGIKRAWDFVLVNFSKRKLDVDFIKEIHRVGFGWIFKNEAGKFRRQEVTISAHIPPKYFLIHQLMEDFIRDLNERLANLSKVLNEKFLDDLISLLAWAHHRFLWIHPFLDYNGRMGRLLINIILLKLKLPPIELRVETKSGREKYLKALQEADNGNFILLENLIRASIEESAKEIHSL